MANESTIHIRNLKFLLTEAYKSLNGLSPPIMNKVFQTNNCPYDLRNLRILASKHKSTKNVVLIQSPLRALQFGKTLP